jgi:hypothetical protein
MRAMASEVALIVVDMQEYFCRDNSAFAKGVRSIVSPGNSSGISSRSAHG